MHGDLDIEAQMRVMDSYSNGKVNYPEAPPPYSSLSPHFIMPSKSDISTSEEEVMSASEGHSHKRQPCYYFLSGYCRNGTECPDYHGMDSHMDELEVVFLFCLSLHLSTVCPFICCLSACLSVLQLSVCLCLHACLSLSACLFLSICLSLSIPACLSICLSLPVCLCLSVCVCLSLSLSLSVYLSVCLCLSVCVCLSLSLSLSVYLSVCLCLSVSVCLSLSLSVYVSPCLSVCLSLPVCLSLSVCLFVSVCLSVCLSLSVCLCLSVSVCLSLCLSVCLSTCLSLSLPVFLSVCLSVLSSLLSLQFDDLMLVPIPAKIRVHSGVAIGRSDINSGDKIILSPHILMSCEQQELSYPMV